MLRCYLLPHFTTNKIGSFVRSELMRKLLWMILLFGAYIWAMTSGHDRMIVDQGKNFYQAIVAWLDDADVDFQVKQKTKVKKKSRRWD